jgi:hypothetical protein
MNSPAARWAIYREISRLIGPRLRPVQRLQIHNFGEELKQKYVLNEHTRRREALTIVLPAVT